MSPFEINDSTALGWFILRGEIKYGPYPYSTLIRMLQEGEIYDYNFVWASHLEKWTVIGELAEFSKDHLQLLFHTKNSVTDSFKKRSVSRSHFKTAIYGHNNTHFFTGHTISISENGALMLLNNPLLLQGEKILVHFIKTKATTISFNVVAEVIRKNYSKNRLNVNSGLHYAVRFLQVQDIGKKEIIKWSNSQTETKEEKNGIL